MIGDDGTASEVRRQTAEALLECKAELVREFFKRNPRVDPKHVCLVTKVVGGNKILFYIDFINPDLIEEKVRVPSGKREANKKRRAKAKTKTKHSTTRLSNP